VNGRPTLFLLGASRGTGLEIAKLARAQGHRVYAMVRTPSPALEALGVEMQIGDAMDRVATEAAYRRCGEVEAVISTLGGTPGEPNPNHVGTVHLVDAIVACNETPRLVITSSLGAGESRAYASERLLAALGAILEAKTKAEAYVAASGLPYTIVRPGALRDRPASHTALLSPDPGRWGSLSRADLAALLLATLETAETIGQTYSAIDPGA